MIVARAPGKVVLWGEYAVLAGAPAAVIAVNRHAVCELAANPAHRFVCSGFTAPAAEFKRLPDRPPERQPAALLAWHVLKAFAPGRVGTASLGLGSDAFYCDGRKLGLGSSAALCVAIEGACARFADEAPNFLRAREAHRQFQDGRGSGIDVAASFFGGALRFQDGAASPLAGPLPECRFLWTGGSAATGAHLDRFAAWLRGGSLGALEDLCGCAQRLCDVPALSALTDYVRALKRLDQVAELNIYTPVHRMAEGIAKRYSAVYKPCGAGGGDLGAVFAESSGQLLDFAAAATTAGLTLLSLEAANNGITVRA